MNDDDKLVALDAIRQMRIGLDVLERAVNQDDTATIERMYQSLYSRLVGDINMSVFTD